jgi:ribosomal protein S25
MLQAIEFVQMWRSYTNEIVERVGLTRDERLYDNILNLIARHPGSTRGHIMQHYRLNARSIELALQTLEQRGQITRLKQGKGERLFPAATHTKKVTIND